MNFFQTTVQAIEVGKGQFLTRFIPLLVTAFLLVGAYNFGPVITPIGTFGGVYHGLSDAQSMDNAQLARQIVRHQGYTTKFLRPMALTQIRDFRASPSFHTTGSHDLFPADRFPAGTPKVLPDTYNAPGYPYLLAAWFFFVHPEFDEPSSAFSGGKVYSADRWIPFLNQGFMLLTAILVFALGRRLFDDRVAWLAVVAFLGSDLVWHYTLTALSTNVLMFLITAMLMCLLEVYAVSEACFTNEDYSFGPAWLWGLAAAILLVLICLTRLHFVILLAPLFVLLILMPRRSFLLFLVMAVIVTISVLPWFLHLYAVTGNPLGSNFTQALYGEGDYQGNQIWCTTSIPGYQQLLRQASHKEIVGFRYHLEHAWELLGSNPFILFFGASILHQYRRRRTLAFHWLLFGCAIVLIAANNIGVAKPEAISSWNAVAVLVPAMVVMGSAFFFILLDRLDVQIPLLNSLIVITTVAVTLLPMILTLTTAPNTFYAFPPYMPPVIKSISQYSDPDEWVTSDLPWATAWYADRASLWLPDSLNDFENLHDNVCPTGILLLTPVSWSGPISTFTKGEYKDWFFLVGGGAAMPPGFPLTERTVTGPGGPDYSVWSDRPRWQSPQ
jgi:4-amino-4-deoxy-L-arabinose transferase-like glycosyltransferase